jgi:hypothetical protein
VTLPFLPMLALLPLLAGLAPPAAAQPSVDAAHGFIGVKRCGSCHKKELYGDQVAAWRRDVHAKAYQTLLEPRSSEVAKGAGVTAPPAEAPECLACHVTAHGVATAKLVYELDPGDGVQCESCHGPGQDYRKKKIMSDPELAASKGLWNAAEDEAVCTACHNAKSPTWDPKRFALPGGGTAPFDFELGKARFPHPIPEDVKGKVVEIEKQRREEGAEDEDDL